MSEFVNRLINRAQGSFPVAEPLIAPRYSGEGSSDYPSEIHTESDQHGAVENRPAHDGNNFGEIHEERNASPDARIPTRTGEAHSDHRTGENHATSNASPESSFAESSRIAGATRDTISTSAANTTIARKAVSGPGPSSFIAPPASPPATGTVAQQATSTTNSEMHTSRETPRSITPDDTQTSPTTFTPNQDSPTKSMPVAGIGHEVGIAPLVPAHVSTPEIISDSGEFAQQSTEPSHAQDDDLIEVETVHEEVTHTNASARKADEAFNSTTPVSEKQPTQIAPSGKPEPIGRTSGATKRPSPTQAGPREETRETTVNTKPATNTDSQETVNSPLAPRQSAGESFATSRPTAPSELSSPRGEKGNGSIVSPDHATGDAGIPGSIDAPSTVVTRRAIGETSPAPARKTREKSSEGIQEIRDEIETSRPIASAKDTRTSTRREKPTSATPTRKTKNLTRIVNQTETVASKTGKETTTEKVGSSRPKSPAQNDIASRLERFAHPSSRQQGKIEVNIGRVEINAGDTAPPSLPDITPPPARKPTISLEDYLQRKNGAAS